MISLSGQKAIFLPDLIIAALIIISIMVIVSIAFLFGNINNKKIKSRKTFSLLIWLFLISIAVYMVMPPVSVEIIWIIAIPASYFLTHYFIFMKKKLDPGDFSLPAFYTGGCYTDLYLIMI